MKYRSTRQTDPSAPNLTFEEAVLEGLAPDGGLYIPTSIPAYTLDEILAWKDLQYHELAFKLFRPYISSSSDPKEGGIPDEDLRDILRRSFGTFTHPDVTPVEPLPNVHGSASAFDRLHVLELFHGPTYAFKDVALQVLGNLFEFFLARRNKSLSPSEPQHKITVLGATSGDTGGAAIYGLRGKKNVTVFILHPKNRISPVQEQQMTSVLDGNVHNVAVDGGTFDDCQETVKALFSNPEFKQKHSLAAINSINWARILAQTSYYFKAHLSLVSKYANGDIDAMKKLQVQYSVPTGNFGDVLAGYYASRMGLPVAGFIVATNENDILHRFLETGSYSKPPADHPAGSGGVKMTLSPAMDILVSSNFERVLWYFARGDGDSSSTVTSPEAASQHIRDWMASLRASGGFTVPDAVVARARKVFSSSRVSDEETLDAIRRYYPMGVGAGKPKYLLDPHTAVGVVAAERRLQTLSEADKVHTVVLSTASPGKFPEAVLNAVNGSSVGSGILKYEDFAPSGLLKQRGLPRRIVDVQMEGGDRKAALEGVKWVIEQTLGEM
ncbi:threonine synthase [Blyttiomyces sp. JEL0837]|nr:threonine synthase [Blyttiomyces sp. JEL0837]